MKLLEIYISNFGTLSDFKYSFSEGLNTVRLENGAGKTTLSAFICSMLFGLEDTKKPKLDENDRKKYEPWQGGAWGGYLTLSAKGKKYRIERSFAKKAADDTLTVYDIETGKVSDFFSKTSPGEYLLDIDREGFMRTLFLSERALGEKSENGTLSAKLSKLTGVAFDITELEEALKLLEEERKFYYKQGGGGAIPQLERKITELEFKEKELLALEDKHARDAVRIEKEKAELQGKKNEYSKLLNLEKEESLREQIKKEYEKKLSDIKRIEEEISDTDKIFEGNAPTREALYEFSRLKEELNEKTALLSEGDGEKDALPSSAELDGAFILLKESTPKASEGKKSKAQKKAKLLAPGAILFALGVILAFINPLALILSLLGIGVLCLAFWCGAKRKAEALTSLDGQNESSLSAFLDKYAPERSSDEEALFELRQKIRARDMKALESESAKKSAALIEGKIKELLGHYPVFDKKPAHELIRILDAYNYLKKDLLRLNEEVGVLKKKLDGYGKSELDGTKSTAELCREIEEGERALAVKERAFIAEESLISTLDEIEIESAEAKETKKRYENRLSAIKKAKFYIEEEKNNLTAKYLGKTREAFARYANEIADTEDSFFLDTSFVMTKNELGKARTKDSFSKGTRELFSFALRLALIDSLYEGESPFIILDDPFAYFDDEKLSRALALTKKIAKDRQVVYFTPTTQRT